MDERNESAFAFGVDAKSGLDAFYHPYAYAPVLGADLQEAPALAGLTQET